VVIQVNGSNLPGAQCSPAPDAGPYENVHVGIGSRDAPVELFRGDAPSAAWRLEVQPAVEPDGSVDFRGPMVMGRRGDRFLYLSWGTVGQDGSFRLFRRAKICLTALDPALLREAIDQEAGLQCTIDLTDAKGNPVCARLRAPAISWHLRPRGEHE
jgi:hypothetical protein